VIAVSEDRDLPAVPTVEGEIVDARDDVRRLKREVDKAIEELNTFERRHRRKRGKKRRRSVT